MLRKALVFVAVVAVIFGAMGAKHRWDRTVMDQTYNRYCLDMVEAVPTGDDTTDDATHWAVDLPAALYDSIRIINSDGSIACSLMFSYDCGYDTLGTYRFAVAANETINFVPDVYLDSVEVYLAAGDTIDLKFSGYTKGAQN